MSKPGTDHARHPAHPPFVRLTGPMPKDPFQIDPASVETSSELPSQATTRNETAKPDSHANASPSADRRLLIALLVFLLLGAVALVLALAFGIVIPPVLFFACVVLLVIGTIVGNPPKRRSGPPRLGDAPGDRSVGCCPGPRPLGESRRR